MTGSRHNLSPRIVAALLACLVLAACASPRYALRTAAAIRPGRPRPRDDEALPGAGGLVHAALRPGL